MYPGSADGFQSTRSAGSATPAQVSHWVSQRISIHALRRERDSADRSPDRPHRDFNPRAPQGARHALIDRYDAADKFQSTRSAGSATGDADPHGAQQRISIHALRRERDLVIPHGVGQFKISIHALRRERDVSRGKSSSLMEYFNPRAPQGARQRGRPRKVIGIVFQSTRSAGSATKDKDEWYKKFLFQSTRSAGSATAKVDIKGLFCDASITIIRHICVFS